MSTCRRDQLVDGDTLRVAAPIHLEHRRVRRQISTLGPTCLEEGRRRLRAPSRLHAFAARRINRYAGLLKVYLLEGHTHLRK